MKSKVTLKKPVIVVGSGRSGTTIFYNMLVRHPNVAYPTFLSERYPSKPHLNRWLLHLLDIPFLENVFMKRHNPAECIKFCAHSNPAFIIVNRDLKREDVTNKMKEKMKNDFSQILTKKRYRLAIKRTGWPMMGYFLEIFPDVRFIYLIRDGRAVANSLLHVSWWWGWRGPESWRFGMLPPQYREEWEKYNKSFVALAAIEWKIVLNAFEEARKDIPQSQYIVVKYEDVVEKPLEIFKKVIEFIDLPYTKSFEKRISQYQLRNMNYKWKKDLTPLQQEILNDVLKTHLAKYGYL